MKFVTCCPLGQIGLNRMNYMYALIFITDMSFQGAQRVMSSDPQRALKVLRDISQNLPMQTR